MMLKILVLLCFVTFTACWTTEDMELFDLVESTPQNFYSILGVNERASSSEIKKAYRKLSTKLHPDRNKNENAEEEFRKVAAVADILRNEERRKTYDLILKMGLPDWRAPIYYYRRVRNMGLFELAIFLFCLATFFQYIYNWASYWEKKYNLEEILMSRKKKKPKHQKKGIITRADEEEMLIQDYIARVAKPKCSDLFPVRLLCYMGHLLKSSPSYAVSCREYFKPREPESEEEEIEEAPAPRVRLRKIAAKPQIPDYSDIPASNNNETSNGTLVVQDQVKETEYKRWILSSLTEAQLMEFKKALKKFPVGTLQRWEKVALHLGCSVADVVTMVKQLKAPKSSKGVPISTQGVTGTENENAGSDLFEAAKGEESSNCILWKQEEQQSLEVALQKFPKDTPGRWDKIADYVATKTKGECVERFKLLAQQVKKRKAA